MECKQFSRWWLAWLPLLPKALVLVLATPLPVPLVSPKAPDGDINELAAGKSTKYCVTCAGRYGVGSDSGAITTKMTKATTTPLKRKYKGSWSGNDITISAGRRIILRWSSDGATDCSATGNGFDVSGTSGNEWSVNGQNAGTSETYTVTCTWRGG